MNKENYDEFVDKIIQNVLNNREKNIQKFKDLMNREIAGEINKQSAISAYQDGYLNESDFQKIMSCFKQI